MVLHQMLCQMTVVVEFPSDSCQLALTRTLCALEHVESHMN